MNIGLTVFVVLLSGCVSPIDDWQIQQATKVCENQGGIDYIARTSGLYVICTDGSLHNF